MNRRMFGNLWTQRAQLGHRLDALKHAHLWGSQDRSKEDHQTSASMYGAQVGPPDSQASAREQLLDNPTQEQRNALTTWEEEGGTTKVSAPR